MRSSSDLIAGVGPTPHVLRLDSCVAVTDQSGHRPQTATLRFDPLHEHDRGGSVVDSRGIARGYRAVLGEHRPELAHRLDVDLSPDVLVTVDDRRALPGRELDRQNLLLEISLGGRAGGAAVALDRQRVLILPGDLPLGGHVLGRDAHVAVVERVGQATYRRVDELTVAHPLPPAVV